MLGEDQLKEFTCNNFQRTITKINDRIYHFLGYGHSNVIAIIANNSVILIDCLDSDEYALDMLQDLRKITNKPIETIIFTHSHPDHMGGSGAFRDTVKEVIAFAPQIKILKHYDKLNDVLQSRGRKQHGYGLTDEEAICQGIGMREGKEVGRGKYDFLKPTTLYQQKEVEREIDGIKLKLVSAVGECDDEIFVYLPDDKVICTGDNYYGCFPNLYAIRGTTYRDVATWIDTLNEILSYDAIALLPGHTKPLLGKEMIQSHVGMFIDAIEHILLHTLDCMNKGMSVSETVEAVQLPMKYQRLGNLGEFYGTVEWSVKSIYSGYLGWFDGNPAHLLPVSDKKYQQTLLTLIGEDTLLHEIKNCMYHEDYQLALQLLEFIDRKDLKKECLLQRAKQVTSANARHYYIACAKEL